MNIGGYSMYAQELFHSFSTISKEIQTYVEQFHAHLPENLREIEESRLDDDLICFLFEERNDILKQKLITSLVRLNNELKVYLEQKRNVILESNGKQFHTSKDFCEDIEGIISSNPRLIINICVAEMNHQMQYINEPLFLNNLLNKIEEPINVYSDILQADNILMVVDEFTDICIQSMELMVSMSENTIHPFQTIMYVDKGFEIGLYAIYFLENIKIV